MEKETVLEIEFKQVWDKWAYRITKNELFNLRGELKEYENKALQLKLKKEYESSFFILIDTYIEIPDYTLLSTNEKRRLEGLVRCVNEKYGKPKRWRAEYEEIYFYINSLGEIYEKIETHDMKDNKHYECGNYFQTHEQAEKALEKVKKAYQEVGE